MRLNKIKSLCVAAYRAELMVETNAAGDIRRQWISNGSGLWILTGLPTIGTENISTILGLSAKQAEKMRIGLQGFPESIDSSDFAADDVVLTPAPCSVICRGVEFLLLIGSPGETFTLEKALLGPIWTGNTQLVLRRTESGMLYIVVMDGLFVTGIVLPTIGVLTRQDVMAIRPLIANAE